MVIIGTACFTVRYLQFIKFYYVLCNPQNRQPLFIAAAVTLWPSKIFFWGDISGDISVYKYFKSNFRRQLLIYRYIVKLTFRL
jgi:hypothetical protein